VTRTQFSSPANSRVSLRRLALDDAPFIFELLNDPDFIANIADRGVRSVEDASAYIAGGPIEMYEKFGFGLWCLQLKTTSTQIGICGLLKRDWLEDVDIGFALLPDFRGQGYAREAALLTLARAKEVHGIARVVAIVSPGNERSVHLLNAIGMQFERMVQPMPGAAELQLFSLDLA
jgi:ribosomal-protein-alanine N-acetyltransferase